MVDLLLEHAAGDLPELEPGLLLGPAADQDPQVLPAPAAPRRAPSSYAGATITSVNTSATCSAIATDTGRLAAITPPNAETGSHACARRCASAMSAPTAMPHGLACLMIATAGSAKS